MRLMSVNKKLSLRSNQGQSGSAPDDVWVNREGNASTSYHDVRI